MNVVGSHSICYIRCLEPKTTIYKWMFGETAISYIKIWFIIQLKQPFKINGSLGFQVHIYFLRGGHKTSMDPNPPKIIQGCEPWSPYVPFAWYEVCASFKCLGAAFYGLGQLESSPSWAPEMGWDLGVFFWMLLLGEMYIWVFPTIGVPQNGWWKSWKTLLKWMIWGENPLVSETSIWGVLHRIHSHQGRLE